MRLIVGISGASGVIYGIRLLEALRAMSEVETHLVISKGGKLNIRLETARNVEEVETLTDIVHSDQNLAASISSGSFQTGGMGNCNPFSRKKPQPSRPKGYNDETAVPE